MLSITSDIKYIGTFEAKILSALNFLRLSKNAVLLIDEIHKAMGAGASSKNTNTLSQHLKEFLEDEGSDVNVIGATTRDEHEELVAKDKAFGRRFNTMVLHEPTDEQALQIFSFYCASEEIKKIYPPLAITQQNIRTMLEAAKAIKSEVSIVDRSKKVIEAVATAAKRLKRDTVDDDFIHRTAHKLII
jgi:SpoVK/Ycf46/Vps4 family AAA+-type ATPase